jgi:hypothetical protein
MLSFCVLIRVFEDFEMSLLVFLVWIFGIWNVFIGVFDSNFLKVWNFSFFWIFEILSYFPEVYIFRHRISNHKFIHDNQTYHKVSFFIPEFYSQKLNKLEPIRSKLRAAENFSILWQKIFNPSKKFHKNVYKHLSIFILYNRHCGNK